MELQNELDMTFNYEPIYFGTIKAGEGEKLSDKCEELLSMATEADLCLADIIQRTEGRWSRFNEKIVWDKDICCTVQAHGMYRGDDRCKLSIEDYRNAQTFPQDYDFCGQSAAYICGMSVPPLMIKRVVNKLLEQGVFDVK